MKLVREHINEISLGGSHLERMGVGMKTSIRKWFDAVGVSPKKYIIYDDLTIDVIGHLDLEGTQITSLPDNLSVGGCLDLKGTPITSLPDNLSVGGWLNLSETPITSLQRS